MKKIVNNIILYLWNIAHYFRKLYWRTFKIRTVGARVIIEKNKKILLVKHRYGNLWVLPGGGMKKGENPKDVVIREAKEEVNISILNFKGYLGQYKNTQEGKNDTVYILIANSISIEKQKSNFEIKERGWFDIDNLPKTTSLATRRRINEFVNYKEEDSLIESAW